MDLTRDKILDVALCIIQTKSYSDMSLQEIADSVGIKKPSIFYHFSGKSEIGKAVIRRYHNYFKSLLETACADQTKNSWDVLEVYFSPFRQFGQKQDRACLCGVLASEYMTLPEDIKLEIDEFFKWHHDWLAQLFKIGEKNGDFSFFQTPEQLASIFFNSLQGALLSVRVFQDVNELEKVISVLKVILKFEKTI